MLTLVLELAVVGFLVYLVVTYIPMPPIFKQGITVIVVILVILYLINLFGFDIPIPHRR